MDALQSVPEFLQEPEIKKAVMHDLAFGYPLMILGAWSSIKNALANSRRQIVSTETELITRI